MVCVRQGRRTSPPRFKNVDAVVVLLLVAGVMLIVWRLESRHVGTVSDVGTYR